MTEGTEDKGTGADNATEGEGRTFEGGIGDTTVTLLLGEATASTSGTVLGMGTVSEPTSNHEHLWAAQ